MSWSTGAALLLLVYRAAWVPRARWLSGPMAALGRNSYGIHIWHPSAASVAPDRVPGWRPGRTSAGAEVLEYAAGITVGVVATVAVEKPVPRLRERLLQAPDRAVQQQPATEERAVALPLAPGGRREPVRVPA